MNGRQMAMEEALEDLDRYELERERREADAIKARLDEKYGRMDYRKLQDAGYPEGSVVIIAQNLYRNGRYRWHFYRTVLSYWSTRVYPKDYTKTAAEILSACRAWYSEPENEDEYKRSGKRWKRETSNTRY